MKNTKYRAEERTRKILAWNWARFSWCTVENQRESIRFLLIWLIRSPKYDVFAIQKAQFGRLRSEEFYSDTFPDSEINGIAPRDKFLDVPCEHRLAKMIARRTQSNLKQPPNPKAAKVRRPKSATKRQRTSITVSILFEKTSEMFTGIWL